MRAFLAIVPPRAVREAIEKVRDPLRDLAPGGRWVHPSLWHLTLKFLGEVEDDLVPAVSDLVGAAVADIDAFDMALGGTGLFPSPDRPRVLWVGCTQGAEPFTQIAELVDEALDGLGFEPEDKLAKPHMTIARFRSPHEAGELPAHIGPGEAIDSFVVEEVVLMKSVLRPRGPDYTVVDKLPLKPRPQPEEPEQPEQPADSAGSEQPDGEPTADAIAAEANGQGATGAEVVDEAGEPEASEASDGREG